MIEKVCVVTSDGRIIIGQLVGHDQVQNLILSDAFERVYSESSAVEIAELGLYVVRGDNVAMVADYDADVWKKQDGDDGGDATRAKPLPPIIQQRN